MIDQFKKRSSLVARFISASFVCLLLLCSASSGSAHPDQLWEDYILAAEPQAWLDALPEGSESRRYFSIVHAQSNRDLKTAGALLKSAEVNGQVPYALKTLQTRQLLLTLGADQPDQVWDKIRELGHVNLRQSAYQPPQRDASAEDQAQLKAKRAREAQLTQGELNAKLKELRESASASQLTSRGQVASLLSGQWGALSDEREERKLISLLQAVQHLSPPDLLEMIQRLPHPKWENLSLLNQLSDQDLHTLLSSYKLTQSAHQRLFKRLLKLTSRAEEVNFDPYRLSVQEFERYITRLHQLVNLTSDEHQSFKAHLLLAELSVAEHRGEWPLEPLLSYLSLPHQRQHYLAIYNASLRGQEDQVSEPYVSAYQHPDWLQKDQISTYGSLTGLSLRDAPSVLVARHIEHHLKERRHIRRFIPHLDEQLLVKMWAKRHILSGGDLKLETLREYLRSDDYRLLSELKLLRFTSKRQHHFKRDQEITLELQTKGYEELTAKVYTLNMRAYLKQNSSSIPIGLDLSGLEPNRTQKQRLKTPKQITTSTLTFPELTTPGVYVIDVQAGDEKIRALIHKGSLNPYVIDTPSGPELFIVDDLGAQVSDVEVSVDGRAYQAEPSGRFRLPYRAHVGASTLLMTQGDLTVKRSIEIPQEEYKLQLSVVAPQLRGGASNRLLVRARLGLNHGPLPLTLLKDLTLTLNVKGADGTPQARVIPNPEFNAIGELTLPVQLPLGFQSITLNLSGKLKSITQGEELKLSAREVSLTRNQDLMSTNIGDVLFVPGATPPRLELIGRSGEPLIGVSVNLTLQPLDYTQSVSFTKRSDARGVITLPSDLSAMKSLEAQFKAEKSDRFRRHRWSLQSPITTGLRDFTARAGEAHQLMWSGSDQVYLRHQRSQRSVRGALKVARGVLSITALDAGEYELIDVGEQKSVALTIFPQEAKLQGQLWLTPQGITPHHPAPTMRLAPLRVENNQLEIQVEGASDHASLHLILTPYALDHDTSLHAPRAPHQARASLKYTIPTSAYGIGQILSEEMRYILKRQRSGGQVGNLAATPSLLVNRADQGEAESVDRPLEQGRGLRSARASAPSPKMSSLRRRSYRSAEADEGKRIRVDSSLRSWDFLAQGAALRWSIPVKSRLSLPLDSLKEGGQVHLLLTDGQHSVYRTLKLADQNTESQAWIARADLRTPATTTPPQRVNVIQRQRELLGEGQTRTLPDLNSRWTSYETLESVYELYQRLLPHADLPQLKRLLTWPKLKDAEKLTLYGELGSHEADLFIFHKDPTFFKANIAPMIRQKGYLSFLERWMLDQDLSEYLAPHRFERLNLLEQLLLLKHHKTPKRSRAQLKPYIEQQLAAHPVAPSRLQMLFQAAIAPSLKATSPPTSSISLKGAGLGGGGLGSNWDGFGIASEAEEVADVDMDDSQSPADGLRARRDRAPRLYQGEGATHQWIERRYWGHADAPRDLISVNRFWRDFALHDPASGPFISPHFPEAATHFNSAWLALAILDLPFEGQAPQAQVDQGKLKLTARDAGLFFYEGAIERPEPRESQVSIRREYWSLNDYGASDEHNPKEFRIGVPYQVKLTVMNPTQERVECELSHPIPEGAILLISEEGKRTLPPQQLRLNPHEIKVSGYSFYFPYGGQFTHRPAYVTSGGELRGVSETHTLNVVRELTQLNQESWSDVARLGSHAEVMTFLRSHNPREMNLSAIYNRLPDSAFYRELIQLLDELRLFDREVWSYALKHHDLERARELFTLNTHFKRALSPYAILNEQTQGAPLIDAYAQLEAQHFDFDPLTVARAHSRGKIDAMTHAKMRARYLELLRYLAHKPRASWTLYDHLAVTYSLVKQGRLNDALATFKRAERSAQESATSSEQRMYFDYLSAYLAISKGEVKRAQEIARAYRDVTPPQWRERFKSIYDPEELGVEEAQSQKRAQESAQSGVNQSLEFKLEGAELVITSYQLKSAELRLYPINLEVLFSNSPTSLEGDEVSVSPFVKPSFTQTVQLAASGETRVSIPAEWRNKALQVEVREGALSQVRSYAPQSFKQHIFRQRGLMRISAAQAPHAPIAGAYVKIYVKLKSGVVRFYKDGYTDYRGIFDYLNANPAPDLASVERVMMLTLTRDHGSSVRSARPPAR